MGRLTKKEINGSFFLDLQINFLKLTLNKSTISNSKLCAYTTKDNSKIKF